MDSDFASLLRDFERSAGRLDAPADRPRPVVLPSYGGTRRHPNLTALVALLLQRYGIPVLVHGPSCIDVGTAIARRDDSGTAGGHRRGVTTADVLWELGIEAAANLADAQARLARGNVTYVPIGVLVPGYERLLERRAHGDEIPPLHALAALLDPFGGDGYRVVPASTGLDFAPMREVLIATCANALLMRGTEGEPFASGEEPGPVERFAAGAGTVCAEAANVGAGTMSRLPAADDASAIAAWIAQALAGTQPVPAPIVAQLACCLDGARR